MKRPHAEVFDGLKRCPEMYLLRADFSSISAYVSGYDMACEGGALVGFHEWLALKAQHGANWGWPSLVLHIAGLSHTTAPERGSPEDARAVAAFFALYEEFAATRLSPNGLSKIFAAFERWRIAAIS